MIIGRVMKVLVIGSGGREHALLWKISHSSRLTAHGSRIYCAPGNAGIAQIADCVNIKAEDIQALLSFAKKEGIDLTVVGPEVPLTLGIVDEFEKAGLRIFGASRRAAEIEGSKASDTEKVFNLLKSILEAVRENAAKEPYLISIGERAEMIAALYKERQKNTQQTLKSLKELIEAINAARKQQAETRMTGEVFSVFWILKREGVGKPDEVANEMTGVLAKYPHWAKSERHERQVRQALYRNLVKGGLSNAARLADLCKKVMTALKGGKE